jgi:hypothetical protein
MGDRRDDDLHRARAAKAAAVRLAQGVDAVNGVGVTRSRGRYAVKISLARPVELAWPAAIDGVPVLVEVVGPVTKRTARSRSGT